MNKPKKPGWVTAVAITAIILSGFGVLGGVQEAINPLILEAQRAEYQQTIDQFKSIIADGETNLPPDQQYILKMMQWVIDYFEKIFNMPDWYLKWQVISGLLSMAINTIYLLAAIWLMQLKPSAPRYLAMILPASIALGITRVLMAVAAFGDFAYMIMGGAIIAVIIELVLLIVLLRSDKSAFEPFVA